MAAVEEVLERRRTRGGYEALVAWAETDPETGEAWPRSWVPEAWLSADLRRKRVRRPARRESVEERRARRVGEQQRVARRKRVEEARRLGETAERDRRASSRGARDRVRKGVVVGSPGGGVAKAMKRNSPRKSLRVRSGVAVGSPEGDVRKVARDGGGGGSREGAAEVAGGDVRRCSRRLFDGSRGGTSADADSHAC